jgi:hypothetical protein
MMKRCADSIDDKGDAPKRMKPNAEPADGSSSGSSDSGDDQTWEPLSDAEESGDEVGGGYETRSKGKVPCLVDSDAIIDDDVYKADSSSSESDESVESSEDEPDTEDDEYSDDDSFVTSEEEEEPAALVRCDTVEISDPSVHDSTRA